MPVNLRVEQQIYGRTARKGNYGDAIIITKNIFKDQMIPYEDIEFMKEVRDKQEYIYIDTIQEFQVRKIKENDALFDNFQQFINSQPDIK